jgi:hypothetical protein
MGRFPSHRVCSKNTFTVLSTFSLTIQTEYLLGIGLPQIRPDYFPIKCMMDSILYYVVYSFYDQCLGPKQKKVVQRKAQGD